MAEYVTEEQQVEAIKQFWKENGSAIILGAVIGFGALFGWNYYKEQQQVKAEEASAQYASAVQSIVAGQTEHPEFEKKAEALKSEYSETTYASLAALKMAQHYVEQNKLDQAAEQLRWVVDQTNDTFEAVANIRLARVLLEQDKYQETIAIVSNIKDEAYKSTALLIKGEALLGQQQVEQAKTAFVEARDASENITNPLLAMRLSEFGLTKDIE